jgi:hypothetical protein
MEDKRSNTAITRQDAEMGRVKKMEKLPRVTRRD